MPKKLRLGPLMTRILGVLDNLYLRLKVGPILPTKASFSAICATFPPLWADFWHILRKNSHSPALVTTKTTGDFPLCTQRPFSALYQCSIFALFAYHNAPRAASKTRPRMVLDAINKRFSSMLPRASAFWRRSLLSCDVDYVKGKDCGSVQRFCLKSGRELRLPKVLSGA